jgi:hypothetical protein
VFDPARKVDKRPAALTLGTNRLDKASDPDVVLGSLRQPLRIVAGKIA